jgi:hypothetical protein
VRPKCQITYRRKNELRKGNREVGRGFKQLICLSHHPGWSGNTAVTDLLIAYAQKYCSFIDSRTIVIYTMSEVAGILLMGETTHGSVHLNQT